MKMIDNQPPLMRVTDMKQFDYCPRVLYFEWVLPAIRPITYKMEAGSAEHLTAEKREQRRSLKPYGINAAQRHFNVHLSSPTLGINGVVDMVIETADQLIPVDYKLSKKVSSHFKLQVMAYGKLLAENSPKTVTYGFIYLIPSRTAVKVPFTPHLRRKADRTISAMQTIASAQQMPPAPTGRSRCVDCEFRRFCNDVL